MKGHKWELAKDSAMHLEILGKNSGLSRNMQEKLVLTIHCGEASLMCGRIFDIYGICYTNMTSRYFRGNGSVTDTAFHIKI